MAEPLKPAFRSDLGAALYCALLVFFLLSPLLFGVLGLPARRDRYREMSYQTGAFPYVEQQIFDEEGDIDLLVLGPSYAWYSMDTPYLQAELSRALGRPAVARTFGTTYRSEDMYYALLRDVLRRRRVHAVVFNPPSDRFLRDEPYPYAHRFFLYFDDAAMLDGLPLRNRVQLWAENVLGAPRHLLTLLRANPPDPASAAPYAAKQGALMMQEGYLGAPFVPRSVTPPPLDTAAMIYNPGRAGRFRFSGIPLKPYQAHFLRLFKELAQRHHTTIIALHVPMDWERDDDVVRERLDWTQVLGAAAVVGVPQRALFAGLTPAQIQDYYCDSHVNANGAALFTRAVAPALIQVYQQTRLAAPPGARP